MVPFLDLRTDLLTMLGPLGRRDLYQSVRAKQENEGVQGAGDAGRLRRTWWGEQRQTSQCGLPTPSAPYNTPTGDSTLPYRGAPTPGVFACVSHGASSRAWASDGDRHASTRHRDRRCRLLPVPVPAPCPRSRDHCVRQPACCSTSSQ